MRCVMDHGGITESWMMRNDEDRYHNKLGRVYKMQGTSKHNILLPGITAAYAYPHVIDSLI